MTGAPRGPMTGKTGARVGITGGDRARTQAAAAQVAYSQSKLATVMFTYELARRIAGTGVTATVLHPGLLGTAFLAEDPSLLSKIMIPPPWRGSGRSAPP